MVIPTAGEDMENGNFHSLVMERQSDIVTLEDNLVVTYKAKYTFSIQCNSHAPCYLSKEAERSFSSTQNLHMNIYYSYIHNCQHLEAAKMFFSR